MIRSSLLVAVYHGLSVGAFAQEFNCIKPEWPQCVFDADVWANERDLQTCYLEMEEITKSQNEYRECLWEYRDNAIFKTENAMNHLVAEMAAMHQFTQCILRAGPNATRKDIERCPLPVFAAD